MANALVGFAFLLGWFAWATLCAVSLRIALSYAGRKIYGKNSRIPQLITYPIMLLILVASSYLHDAVFGQPVMYGGNGASFTNYIFAPFGLPLLVGLAPCLLIDLVRIALKREH